MIFYLLLTLFAIRSLQLLCKGRLVNTLGINLSDPSFDSGSESAGYMATLNSAKDAVEDGQGNQLSSSVLGLSGVTMADTWRLNTSFTGGQDPITSNLEQVDINNFDNIGNGMSFSSGVFTFPYTGRYAIIFYVRFRNGTSNDRACDAIIDITVDGGTNWSRASTGSSSIQVIDSNSTYQSAIARMSSFKVSDTSQQKIRIGANTVQSNTGIIGNTDDNQTYVEFIRLGDI